MSKAPGTLQLLCPGGCA